MRQITATVGALATADPDGIAQSQTPTAGALTLNGVLVTGGVAYLASLRQVVVVCAGNESSRTFTVTGTDSNGATISDVITGGNVATVTSAIYFFTVTEVTISGNAAGAVTVGTNGVGVSRPLPLDIHGKPQVSLQVAVSGTVNWTVQQTLDTPYQAQDADIVWFDHPDANMVSETGNRQGNYAYIPAAVRLLLNSGTGSATLTIIQAGIAGL